MTKKALLAIVLIFVPGAGVAYGSYLLYRTLKRKPRSTQEFINSLKEEMKNGKSQAN